MAHAPRIYGSDGETDSRPGPEPGHDYREVVGGPLDGQLLDVTDWSKGMLTTGAYLIAPLSAYGTGGRASHEPASGASDDVPFFKASRRHRPLDLEARRAQVRPRPRVVVEKPQRQPLTASCTTQ